jgi:hypothetical protein
MHVTLNEQTEYLCLEEVLLLGLDFKLYKEVKEDHKGENEGDAVEFPPLEAGLGFDDLFNLLLSLALVEHLLELLLSLILEIVLLLDLALLHSLLLLLLSCLELRGLLLPPKIILLILPRCLQWSFHRGSFCRNPPARPPDAFGGSSTRGCSCSSPGRE